MKEFLLFVLVLALPFGVSSQGTSKKEVPKNWYQLDKTATGYSGISLDKAYALVKNKKSKQVVVAVLIAE